MQWLFTHSQKKTFNKRCLQVPLPCAFEEAGLSQLNSYESLLLSVFDCILSFPMAKVLTD